MKLIKNRKLIALFFTLVLMLSLSVNVYATHIDASNTVWIGYYNSRGNSVDLVGEIIQLEQNGYEFIGRTSLKNVEYYHHTASLYVSMTVYPMSNTNPSVPQTASNSTNNTNIAMCATDTIGVEIAREVNDSHAASVYDSELNITYSTDCTTVSYPYH